MSQNTVTFSFMPSIARFASFDTSKATVVLNILQKFLLGICATTCLYKLYNTWQVTYHAPSALLDDDLKLVKCRAKFDEYKEFNKIDSMNECEALLRSVTQKSAEKQAILKGLFNFFLSMKYPLKACEFAKQLTSAQDLLDAVALIHKDNPYFTPGKLADLLTQAFDAGNRQEWNTPLLAVQFWQDFAQKCASLNEYGRMVQALQKADHLLTSFTDPGSIHKIKFRCIQSECNKFVDKDVSKNCVVSAQNLFKVEMPPADVIDAHLTLAKTCLSIGMYPTLEDEFTQAKKKSAQSQDVLTRTKYLPDIISLAEKMKTDKKCNSITFDSEQFITKAYNFVSKSSPTVSDQAKARFNIAKAYQELGDKANSDECANAAFKNIKSAIELTQDLATKYALFDEIPDFYLNLPGKLPEVIALLDTFCEPSKRDEYFINKFSEKLKDQDIQKKWFEDWVFQRLRAHFHKTSTIPRDKIATLTGLFLPNPQAFTSNQATALLVEAETQLPKVEPHQRAEATLYLAEAYLQVNKEKSYDLLDAYENSIATHQAKRHLAIAAIAAVFSAALYLIQSRSGGR